MIPEKHFRSLSDHANDIINDWFYGMNCTWRRKTAVKKTYFAGIATFLAVFRSSSITYVPFCVESILLLYPTVRLLMSAASLTLFFLFSEESRTLFAGRKLLPFGHPSVSIRKPKRYLWFMWS